MSALVGDSGPQVLLDRRDGVDFRVARRRVELLSHVAPETRQRAFACWVGLFDLADAELRVEVPGRRLIELLGGLSRVTWTEYRSVLIASGLLRVAVKERGPYPQVLELLPPMLTAVI